MRLVATPYATFERIQLCRFTISCLFVQAGLPKLHSAGLGACLSSPHRCTNHEVDEGMGDELPIERRRSWNAKLRQRFQRLEERWNRANPPIVIVDPPADNPSGDDRDEWTGLGFPVEQRRLFETARPNVLVIGSGPTVTRVLHLLERVCMQPIVSWDSSPLTLPTRQVGTLAVLHVERLGLVDQQLLYAWLSCAAPPRPQVITTASVPLFPSVVRGTFNDALFYRLNEVCLTVREAPRAQGAHTLASARSLRA